MKHDQSYQLLFSHAEMIADLLRGFPGLEFNNLNELQEVKSMLAERVIEWTEEWKQQGLQQGKASLLLRLMERHFGPLDEALRHRLQNADAETLLCWGDRLLSAATAAEVVVD